MTAEDPSPERPTADLDRRIGAILRDQRRELGLTLADIAERASVSRGMLSKIENGQVSSSLDTLQRLTTTLGLTLAQVFARFDGPAGSAQLVRAGEGLEVVRRGTRRGHTYQLLAHDPNPRKRMEPFLITMDDASEVFPTFTHPGLEFLHMLEGRLEYGHGGESWELGPGDSLTFPGEVPHGPQRLIEVPIRFLAVIAYGGEAE